MPTHGDTASAARGCSTFGERFADGEILELVRDWNGDSVSLLQWDGSKARVGATATHNGKIYRPAPIGASILRAVRLPEGVQEYGSVGQLFGSLLATVSIWFNLNPRDLRLCALWILATWVPEVVNLPPTLFVACSSPIRAASLMLLLEALCRRGLRVAEASPSTLSFLPWKLRLTLLLDQSGLSRSMYGLLRGSGIRGLHIGRKGNLEDFKGARAIFVAGRGFDMASGQDMLKIALPPADSSSPLFSNNASEALARDLQPMLLRYRLDYLAPAECGGLDVSSFTPGVRMLARSLAAVVNRDPALIAQVVPLLTPLDDDVRAADAARPESAIITALLALLHGKRPKDLRVSELTEFVNAALRAGGEIVEYSPEEVGWSLSHLGLFTRRVRGGRGLRFDRDVSRTVHSLARSIGVSMTPNPYPGCEDCMEKTSETTGSKRLL